MAWSPSYDGYALSSANGIVIPRHRDHGPVRTRLDPLVTGGSVASALELSGRRIDATLRIHGTDASNFQSRMEALLAVLHRQDAAALRLDSTREIQAYCEPGELVPIEGTDGVYAEMKVSWMAESAYWLATTQTTQSGANSGASPITFSASNAGGAPSRVNLQIENTGAVDYTGQTLTVRNTTTGKEFRLFQMDIDAGDTFRLDEDGQAYFEAPIGATSATPKRIDGATFDLDPGSNSIEIEHLFGSGGDITVTLAWYDRYHHLGSYI